MISYFCYNDHTLYAEDVPIPKIVEAVGTPVYIYSAHTILDNFRQIDHALSDVPHLIFYAVKANGNLSILRLLSQEGAGADIVSGGELFRALHAGVPPEKIVYSGVGKTAREIREALRAGVCHLHVESLQEFERIRKIAQELQITVQLAPRVNPNIDAQTHPYISTGLKENKFGISAEEAKNLFRLSRSIPYLHINGISAHIGSQITKIEPFIETVQFLATFLQERRAEGFTVDYLDMGGGLGIAYNQETSPPTLAEYGKILTPLLKLLGCQIFLEPGRAIVGNSGILVTQVIYTKRNDHKHFTIVDAAMTDCLRPALYGAYHEILPVRQPGSEMSTFSGKMVSTDIVGAVCESSDFLAKHRTLPEPQPGDLLAMMSVGAYGFTMASHYNARPNVPEVLVKGNEFSIIRQRETYEDLIRGELV